MRKFLIAVLVSECFQNDFDKNSIKVAIFAVNINVVVTDYC